MTIPLPSDRSALASASARFPDVRLVVLFGSAVRGGARADSDVDVAVLGGAPRDQLDVGSEMGRLLGREPHVVDLATASDWLRFQIARDGVLIREAAFGLWIELKASAMVRYWDLSPIIALCARGVEQRLLREARRHG